jgi:hypothetical protein
MWLFPTPSAYNPVKSIISPQNNKTAIICTKNTPSARIPPFPPAGSCSMPSLLSDQAMCLSFIKKHAIGGRFSGLGCTFQGQKHGCKDFGLRFQLRPNTLGFPKLISFNILHPSAADCLCTQFSFCFHHKFWPY